uniref:Uncharacterized protein n=1 Tax=Varanus komodoensis TaxID=61221 RepID=A0A8D2KVA4_VARKO
SQFLPTTPRSVLPSLAFALSEANMAFSSQIPPSELLIEPAPILLTIPGPMLSASNAPVGMAQYTPRASGYSSYSTRPYGGHGYGRRYLSGYSYPYYSWRALACSTSD